MMTLEQEAKMIKSQMAIKAMIEELHQNMAESIRMQAFASVEGLCFQISHLSKAYGHVGAAAFKKESHVQPPS
jgi:hypothetical protein